MCNGCARCADDAAAPVLNSMEPVNTLAPHIRLFIVGHTLAELQIFMGMHGEGQQSHHHAFIGLRRMTSQCERVILIIVTLHIRDLQIGFEDGCFDCHVLLRHLDRAMTSSIACLVLLSKRFFCELRVGLVATRGLGLIATESSIAFKRRNASLRFCS